MSKSLEFWGNDSVPLATWLKFIVEGAQPPCTALHRVITDFGADHAFGLVPKKLQEHYGIDLSASTVRAITEFHAKQIYQEQELMTDQLNVDGCKLLIGEIRCLP